jgi:hypothetical protein
VRGSLLIILIVAAISGWLRRAEQDAGVSRASASQEVHEAGRWVRTVDGWETRAALAIRPAPPLEIHPGLVAGVMASASLLALVVFPGRAVAVRTANVEPPVAFEASGLNRKRRRRILAAAR